MALQDPYYSDIKTGMEKAFFACAWAAQCENADKSSMLSGKDIKDLMPEQIDEDCVVAATELVIKLGGKYASVYGTLSTLYSVYDGGLTPSEWGHYAAMQAMGHGVGLSDYGIDIEVPNVECPLLSKEYF